ncbi:MAG: glycosyltransferase family 4 protein [Gemmatimonadaceae bacterium]|nr:glycosyltransferase family 4 protein [Gemmatimonadaceae bacterium]
MRREPTPRVGYVVKRYPRFSETFIVNEILAHEAAGLPVDIFSLYPPNDTHFQDTLSLVKAPVTYLTAEGVRALDFWSAIEGAAHVVPAIWQSLEAARGQEARVVYQAARLAAAVRQRGITHLHAHFATMPAQVARLAARWAGITFSITAHAKDIYHDSVTTDALRALLRDASGVVTVSDYNARYLVETIGVDALRLHRIYNGLDLDRFDVALRSDRRPTILAVGRFVPKKGFDVLLDACALLVRDGARFTCRLVGGGSEEGSLRARATALGLGHVVQFDGPLPQREVMAALREATVFAAPCVVAEDGDRDGLPTVLVEAMALGTPCVATDVVGIPELVRHRETGLLVPPQDAPALAVALRALLEGPALRLQLATDARALIEAAFDVRRNAALVRALFQAAPAASPIAMAS